MEDSDEPGSARSRDEAANIAKVTRLLETGLGGGDMSVLDELLHDAFMLSTPSIRIGGSAWRIAGRETLELALRLEHGAFEGWRVEVIETIAEGRVVAAKWRSANAGPVRGVAAQRDRPPFPFEGLSWFRFRDGRILEATLVSSRDEILTALGDGAPLDGAEGERLVRRFWREVFNGRRLDAIEQIVAPTIRRHSPGVGSGRRALREDIAAIHAEGDLPRVTVESVLSIGSLVISKVAVSFDQPPFGWSRKQTLVDVFRIESGLIVEHWDLR